MNIKAIFFILSVFVVALLLSACGSSVSPVTSVSTVMPTPTADPRQASRVVQAFWGALESRDLETALIYIDDEATCAGNCYFTGKETFRSFLQGYLDRGYVTKLSDLKNVGSIVTYSWEVYRNGNFIQAGDGDEVMHVENGKIVYWENQHR